MKQFFTNLVVFERSGGVTYGYDLTDRWSLLGGTVLATHDLCRHSDQIHSIHLNFHGGKNLWHVEREHWSRFTIFPREDYYGGLSQMMAIFERLSGQALQEVTVAQLGAGVSHFSAQGIRGGSLTDPSNPWELEVGAVYAGLKGRHYRAVKVGEGAGLRVELKPADDPCDYPESFDPALIMEALIRAGVRGQLRVVERAQQNQLDSDSSTDIPAEPIP